MSLPRSPAGLPREIANGLYNPSYLPDELRLNEFIEDPDKRRKEVQESLQNKVKAPTVPNGLVGLDGVPRPLTREEAEEVDKTIEKMRGDIASTRQRIIEMRKFIDETANPADGPELSFKLNISKKPTIKRAVRKVFGIKTDQITYSMYKAALELKRQVEKQESDSYVRGE